MPQEAIESKQVDGETYLFGYLPPRQALALWSRLAKHLLPAFASMAGGTGSVLDAELSGMNWAGAATHISGLLTSEVFSKDVDLLLTTVHKLDNSPVTIDGFPGRIGHVLKVCYTALEVNYADFFVGFKSALDALKGPKAPTEPSQP